jgi:hypothetical protein
MGERTPPLERTLPPEWESKTIRETLSWPPRLLPEVLLRFRCLSCSVGPLERCLTSRGNPTAAHMARHQTARLAIFFALEEGRDPKLVGPPPEKAPSRACSPEKHLRMTTAQKRAMLCEKVLTQWLPFDESPFAKANGLVQSLPGRQARFTPVLTPDGVLDLPVVIVSQRRTPTAPSFADYTPHERTTQFFPALALHTATGRSIQEFPWRFCVYPGWWSQSHLMRNAPSIAEAQALANQFLLSEGWSLE